MLAVARLLLICLVALALPAQGIAAATMQLCAPGHASPDAQAGAPHRHGDAAAESGAAATHAAADDHGHHGKSGFGAHGGCCVATALPASVFVLPVVESAGEPLALVPTAYVGPVVTGLERPPKPRLA